MQKIVWSPQQGAQQLVLSCPCNHILVEGTRGGGKTEVQLALFRRYVGLGYGTHWRGVIFDIQYKNLDDIVKKSKSMYGNLNDGAKFISSMSSMKWVWPTGEELLLRVMKDEKGYDEYHGHEYPFIAWNELTKRASSVAYDKMMSTNRCGFKPDIHSPDLENPLPPIPLIVIATTNPFGPGHNWVKQRFIDPAPAGKVLKIDTEIDDRENPGKKKIITKTQVRIFSSYLENKYLDDQYIADLTNIKDVALKKAWLYGDWDITSGGMFDDLWSSEHNILDPFPIPISWAIYRTFDYGSSAPFSVGWWAVSDGSNYIDVDGNEKHTIRGDIFRIGEWYGWNGEENKGLYMIDKEIAKGIKEMEMATGYANRILPGPADASIFSGTNGVCIAKNMSQQVKINGIMYPGVTFTKSNKKAGTRKIRWQLMRTLIYNARPIEGLRENPGMFIFRNCKDGFLRTVPGISRDKKDPEDINTDSEDHVADETGYFVLDTCSGIKNINTVGF